MVEFATGFAGVVFSGIVSLAVAILLSDRLKVYLGRLLGGVTPATRGIEGDWLATFAIVRDERTYRYKERLGIRKYFGVYFGNIEPSDEKYDELKQVESQRSLRLRAEMNDSVYFTGIWYHPIDVARFHGAFQLTVHPSGKTMSGRWVGYSETLNDIESGEWTFARLSQ